MPAGARRRAAGAHRGRANETRVAARALHRGWHRDDGHALKSMMQTTPELADRYLMQTGRRLPPPLATVTAGGHPKSSAPFQPLPAGFVHVAYNDIDAIEGATSEKTVAVMLEPVMGEIGIIPATPGYLKRVREWCDQHNLLLILD